MIWIARHGETTWNLAGRYQGRLESPLSALGERQGRALAQHFLDVSRGGDPSPARIISSPLLRCTATAAFTRERLDVPLEIDERLIEIAHGTWEGRLRDELASNDPEGYRTWRQDPARVAFENGESLVDVAARWADFAATLVGMKDDVLVVTHDAVVRCALLAAQGRPLDDFWKVPVENGGFATLVNVDGSLRVLDECYVEHLRGLRADIREQAL